MLTLLLSWLWVSLCYRYQGSNTELILRLLFNAEAFWRGTCNLPDTGTPPAITYQANPMEGQGPDGTLLPLQNIADKYKEPFFLDPQVSDTPTGTQFT